jgi:hypothetical protein
VDAGSYISRAIFCHLPATEITSLANTVSRLQDDCSRLVGQPHMEFSNPVRM